MEIYLLREEKQVGPYGLDDLRSWLTHGHVSASELAWAPGLESWVPLKSIMEPTPVPETVALPLPKATSQQKAFLSYVGSSFSHLLTEVEAEEITQHVSADPKLAARVARWEEERLDLHPELFPKELQARKENRPGHFYKLVQTDGGDCFNGVTKAHCQVLVGYLDVNHPRWDANLKDAAWHYFFPAIAEKFPQLVRKEWRPKLKFKDGPKVAAELLEHGKDDDDKRGARLDKRQLVKALAVVAVLGLLASAAYGWMHPEVIPTPLKNKLAAANREVTALITGNDSAPVKKSLLPAPAPETVTKPAVPEPIPGLPESAAPKSPEATPADPAVAGAMEPKPGDPAMAAPLEPKPADPAMTGATPPKPEMAGTPDGMAPTAPPKPTETLFDPKANTAATPPTGIPGLPAAPLTPATPRTDARILQPTQVQSKYGPVTLNVGTSLKIVGREGNFLVLNHMGQAVRVPMAATDFQQ